MSFGSIHVHISPMPSELEDLVEFLHHGNTQIRQIAVENLLPYSTTQPDIFKKPQLVPVQDLKLLVKDYDVCRSALTFTIYIKGNSQIHTLRTAHSQKRSYHPHQYLH